MILVTGASGNVGADIVGQLVAAAGQVEPDVTDGAMVFESVRRARERSGRPAG
ncbi:hypothetical protein [Nonomuraea sp. MG754425]|uniref:hypothetical protein n=1 Tax=Nonomuraea sp. MG754425 TaxID=2570319 RepID=UPI001F1F1273|nr:hypothetical protein [Nonomuraea sp. MG754425]